MLKVHSSAFVDEIFALIDKPSPDLKEKDMHHTSELEVVVLLADGWSLRSGSPTFEAGDYVSLRRPDGSEFQTWQQKQWRMEPIKVMGEILNRAAARREREPATPQIGQIGWSLRSYSPTRESGDYLVWAAGELQTRTNIIQAQQIRDAVRHAGVDCCVTDENGVVVALPGDVVDHSYASEDGKKETVVELADGSTLRTAAGELLGSYVRLCEPDGDEYLYYDHVEWAEDPELVMGALLNAAAGLRVNDMSDEDEELGQPAMSAA